MALPQFYGGETSIFGVGFFRKIKEPQRATLMKYQQRFLFNFLPLILISLTSSKLFPSKLRNFHKI